MTQLDAETEGLADSSGPVDEGFIESTLVGLIGVFVPKMPLPEDSGGIACRLEDLRKDGSLKGHAFTFEDGMGDPVLKRVPTCHDGGPGGGAGWADKKAGKAHALVIEGIEVRGLDPGMSVPAHRAVSLVVGDDQDDVGSFRVGEGSEPAEEEEKWEQLFHYDLGLRLGGEGPVLQAQKRVVPAGFASWPYEYE